MASIFWNLLLYTHTNSTSLLLIFTEISDCPPLPLQVNHELTCCHNYEGEVGGEAGQDEYQGGSPVTLKVGEIDDNTVNGRSGRVRKEVMVCVQDVVGKKKSWVQFEDG